MVHKVHLKDMAEEVQAVARETLSVRTENAKAADRMEKMGLSLDVTTAKLTHVLRTLVDTGIMTEAQFWDMELAWEIDLKSQIEEMEGRVKLMIAQQEAEARKALLAGGAPAGGLVIPGN